MGFVDFLKRVMAPLVGGLLKLPIVRQTLDPVIKTVQSAFNAQPVKISQDPVLEHHQQVDKKRQDRFARKLKALDVDVAPGPADARLPAHTLAKRVALEETELYPEKPLLLPVGKRLHWLVNPEA